MTSVAEVMLRAFWDAIPAESRWRERSSHQADERMFDELATYTRERANVARRYGDRGEVLIRNVADLIALRFWEMVKDTKAQAPRTEADRIADARVWVPAVRAALIAAQAERRPQAEAA